MEKINKINDADILPCSPIYPHTRIKIIVYDINKEIDQYKDYCADYDAPHDYRIIPLHDCFHRKPSDTVPSENGFCQYRSVQVASELEPDDSGNRHQIGRASCRER